MSELYYQKHIFVCTNQKDNGKPCCANHDTKELAKYLQTTLLEKGLHGPQQYRVSASGCLGRCPTGPWAVVYPDGKWVNLRTKEDADTLISELC